MIFHWETKEILISFETKLYKWTWQYYIENTNCKLFFSPLFYCRFVFASKSLNYRQFYLLSVELV